MEKIFTQALELRACDCDMGGAWLPGALLTCMQETAGLHAAMCGLSRNEMDSMGLAWMLSRTRVEMQRVPRIGEKISVETYPTPAKHMFFPRSHIFHGENGETLGCASSLWVVIDIAARRIARGEAVAARLPRNDEMPMAAGMPAAARPLEENAVSGVITPRFTDMDVNGHVNNAKYLDWCCDALGMDAMCQSCIMSFDVNYDAEIRPGAEIRYSLARSEDRFTFCGFNGAKRHFAVSGRLAPRK